jgi:hypothetical protein
LFKDLITLKTKIGSTQNKLSFQPVAPKQRTVAPNPRLDILEQFINAGKQANPTRRQGMLTDEQPKRRFPF